MNRTLLSITLLLLPLPTLAATLFEQLPTGLGGYYSDAVLISGSLSGESTADDFYLNRLSRIEEIEFVGSSDGYHSKDNSDFSLWQVNIFDSKWNPVENFVASASDLQATPTGRINDGGGIEYRYTLDVNGTGRSFELAEGGYRLAIGAAPSDPTTSSFWIWSLGGDPSATNYSNRFDGQGWQTFVGNSDLAFRVSGQPVPEPTSLIALSLGGFAVLRRRKRSRPC